jgi:hypothetical protein
VCTREGAQQWVSSRDNAPTLGRKTPGNLLNPSRDGDRPLQLLAFNEEFLVNAGHQLALITSLPFVHTARRSYRLDDPVKMKDVFCIYSRGLALEIMRSRIHLNLII